MLLSLPPETAHELVISALATAGLPLAGRALRHALGVKYGRRHPALERRALLGLDFANPIGLAAGFDKDGRAIAGLARLGFGWLEVGAVTPRPQAGNPRPRLFRHPEARSLENAMGFNNQGGAALARRLAKVYPAAVPVLVNLGRNKTTPNERAVDDYLELIELLVDRCDGYVLNVSSPNTPGLRELQGGGATAGLVSAARSATELPVLVKLSPDLEPVELERTVEEAIGAGTAAIIVTNTTIDYELLPGARRFGGLSGTVLAAKSRAVLAVVARKCRGRCPVVSVGGIDSGQEAYRRLRAGADLVQLYTALVYEGPGLVARMLDELIECLDRDGLTNIAQAVGADFEDQT